MVERDRETERLIRKGRERPHVLLVVRKTRQTWRNKRAGVQSYSSRKKNFSRQRRKPTTNSTRIWHCYLCPPPQLSVPVSDTGLFCLGRGGWLVYTAYGITFRIRTRAHWRRRVFSAAHYSTPPPPPPPPTTKNFFFLICIHIFLQQAHHLLPLQAELCCYQLEFIMALSLISKVLRDFGMTTELGGHQMMWFKYWRRGGHQQPTLRWSLKRTIMVWLLRQSRNL